MDSVFPKTGRLVEKVSERQERFFDVEDAKGMVCCRVLVTEAKEDELLPWPDGVRGRRLLRCVLRGGSGEDGLEIDVLKIMQEKSPGIRVFLTDAEGDFYFHSENLIGLHGMTSVFDIFILLHEFGHARQRMDKRYKTIYGHYAVFRDLQRRMNEGRAVVRFMTEAIMDMAKVFSTSEFIKPARSALRELSLIERGLEGGGPFAQEPRQSLENRRRRIVMEMKDILDIPKKILERDASARMLQDLRMWRRMGMDLLTPLAPQATRLARSLAARGFCGSSAGNVFTSAIEQMRVALDVYEATTPQLRRTYGTIPRIKDKEVNEEV